MFMPSILMTQVDASSRPRYLRAGALSTLLVLLGLSGAHAQTATNPLGLTPCQPSGQGTDYPVGPGQTYTRLDDVPWEKLKGGDTVRIHYSTKPYTGKFLIIAQGTATAPVRVCGVRGPKGERPVIDGSGATTRAALSTVYGSSTYVRDIHQERSLIVIKGDPQSWTAFPRYIQIDGLKITRAHPDYSFRNAAGQVRSYAAFGACIWIDRGQNISIVDNEISDCQMAIFSKSTDDGDFAVTKNIRVAGNTMWGHGIVDDYHEHTTYLQSVGTIVEFNRYGPLRSGSPGNALKDRSAGAVIRYNRIEEGAHAIDLVEAEDFPATAQALAAYRTTHVYGNQIIKNGDSGSVIHYGGDHFGSAPGANWGEPLFRRGTLYFYNNTLSLTGTAAAVFQISTTLETVEAFNNIFHFGPTVKERSLRMNQWGLGSAWTPGGALILGRNWISTGWQDSDQWHPVPGALIGTGNLIAGTTAPFDPTTFVPLAGSAVLDVGVPIPTALSRHVPVFQLDSALRPVARVRRGTGDDLGAVER
jgi:hypothetical protein